MHRLSQIMARREKLGSGLVGKCELKGALLKPAFKRFNGPGFHCITPAPDGAGLGLFRSRFALAELSLVFLVNRALAAPFISIATLSSVPAGALCARLIRTTFFDTRP